MRRIALVLLIVSCATLTLALVSGALYEQSARKDAAARFPPPGRMIDIGGRRIHLDCIGEGSPTVLFEAGWDPLASQTWSKVHGPVSKFTRACAYDRAGIMWSEPAPGRRGGYEIAVDLDRTLTAAGINGPYVLVGHSMGGPYALLFAKRVGKRVAGLVLVDATHPSQDARLSNIVETPWYAHALQRGFMRTGWTGLPRLLSEAADAENPAAVAFEAPSMAAAADEMDAGDETLRAADGAHELGTLPLVVLTALAPRSPERLRAAGMSAEQDARWRAAWLELQRDEATWSSASRLVVLEDSGHYIQMTKPETVIEAIQQVVDRVRSGG